MKSHAVFFDGIKIGTLYTEKRKHKYVPTENALKLKNSLALKKLWQPTDGFSSPIPFFQNRIEYCADLGYGKHIWDVIGYETDAYRLVRIL